MRLALSILVAVSVLGHGEQLSAVTTEAKPVTSPLTIVVVAPRKVKPGPLSVKLLERPRPPQYGSENLRIFYRLSNAGESAQVFLRIRQGLQMHEWPLSIHEDLTGQETESTTLVDVTGDSFAGQDVRMSLVARDGRGRTAKSKSYDATVPQRFFLHPVAREIARIRSGLINREITVTEATERLAQLSEAARGANLESTVLAAIRQSYWRLHYDKSPESTFELMWLTANHMENSRRLSVVTLADQLDHALSEKDIPMLPTP